MIAEDATASDVLDGLCSCLETQFDIERSTFQLETTDRQPIEEHAHP